MSGSRERLVVPSCQGILDCFNNRIGKYKVESFCCLEGEPDNLLIMAVFSFIYLNPEYSISAATWEFKLSFFKKYIGYVGGGKSNDLPTRMLNASKSSYMWEYKIFKSVMDIRFSSDKRVVTVQSDYFALLMGHMSKFRADRNKWGKKITKGKSTYSSMVFTSILKERNTPSVEITIELVKLIERRGHLLLNENAHISLQALVERCPTLHKQVQNAAEIKEKNRIMKVAVYKSMELLKTHTEIYSHFEGLTVTLPIKFSVSKDNMIIIEYFRRNNNGKN